MFEHEHLQVRVILVQPTRPIDLTATYSYPSPGRSGTDSISLAPARARDLAASLVWAADTWEAATGKADAGVPAFEFELWHSDEGEAFARIAHNVPGGQRVHLSLEEMQELARGLNVFLARLEACKAA
ncbi:MAG: hypothetical protein SFU83_06350 [Meiothermus sp.]|nr:hypothetical protein [Meiothermus sp.]